MRLQKKAAFFDVDGVVYKDIVSIDFMKHLNEKGLLSDAKIRKLDDIIHMHKRDKSSSEFYDESMKLWCQGVLDKEKREIIKEARFFVQKNSDQILKQAVQAMKKDKANGYFIVLITGSPIEVAQSLSELLDADYAIGTEVVQKNGRYTKEVVKPCPVGEGKAKQMQRLAKNFMINLAESKAYGNSGLDIPMLKIVGTRIIVNPDDELAEVAERNSWETEYWH